MPSPEPSSPCVLLVEEDVALRQSLSICFENEMINVDVAEDGAEALRLLELRSYKVLVLDLALPKISGSELMRHLETNPDLHSGQLVVLTEDREAAARVERSERVAHVFIKPLNLDEVARAVCDLCS